MYYKKRVRVKRSIVVRLTRDELDYARRAINLYTCGARDRTIAPETRLRFAQVDRPLMVKLTASLETLETPDRKEAVWPK